MKQAIMIKWALGCAGFALLTGGASMIAYGKKKAVTDQPVKMEHKEAEHKKPATAYKRITPQDMNLRVAMRQLWVDHAVWTHEYLVFATQDIGADYKKLAAARLLKNQDDIGNAIIPVYGEKAGKKLASLLRDHILIAVEVVDAAKKGDTQALKKADEKWHSNAKDIAKFLHGANPQQWGEADLVAMLNNHLALTTKEAVALLGKQWADVVSLYDEIIAQLMMMADQLSTGIVKQFPEAFGYRPIRKMVRKAPDKMHLKKKA